MKSHRVLIGAGVLLLVLGAVALFVTLPGGGGGSTNRPEPGASMGEILNRPAFTSSKVLSYFQSGKTFIDTRKALNFVVLPKAAVTAQERDIQIQFCVILLASMDFVTPGEAATRTDVLATYWPIAPSYDDDAVTAMFEASDCAQLLAAYDFKLARRLAANAGVQGFSGPLLITWPSAGAAGDKDRYPLIIDFSKADYPHASKTLQYWFAQVRNRPELWTSRIREGTIRAELADAVNDTAGVILSVFSGKWEKLSEAGTAP